MTVFRDFVLASPEAGVSLAVLLPALLGHLLLLVVVADVGVEVHPVSVEELKVLADVKPCGHWTILDQLHEFVLIGEVFVLIICHFGLRRR